MKRKYKYIIAILLGIYFTPISVKEAAIQRGCEAFGGEWLIIPLFLLFAVLGESVKEFLEVANER